MRANRLLIVVLAGTAVVLGAWLYLRPAFISEERLRASLFAATPLGSRLDEVRGIVERRGWAERGARLTSYMTLGAGDGEVVNAFAGCVRRDPFPYRTSVSATWEFDLSNRLVNIRVLRHE